MTDTTIIWVRWRGTGRHAFPYPPGKEVELHPGFNKLTQRVLDAITGGIDSEGRARGGTAAAYWNAKPPMLGPGREPMPDEEFHEPLPRVGVTQSRRSKRRAAERNEINDLRNMVLRLQAQIEGGEVPAEAPTQPDEALEQVRAELRERERELDQLRGEAAEAAELRTETERLRGEAQAARAEAAEAAEELDEATTPVELAVDPSDLTLKDLATAIDAEGVTRTDLAATLQAELGRAEPRSGAIDLLTKAITSRS